jgi:hypothetical protein
LVVGVAVGVVVFVAVAVGVDVAAPGMAVRVAVDVAVRVAVFVAVAVGVDVAAPGMAVRVAVDVVVGVAVDVVVGVAVIVAVALAVEVVVAVAVAAAAAQNTGVMVLSSSDTAPVRARALPSRLAPVFMVMLASARMFPLSEVVVSTVAELPTCQNRLQPGPEPPLVKTTDEPGAVVSVLPIWKTQTELGSPKALRMSCPVN